MCVCVYRYSNSFRSLAEFYILPSTVQWAACCGQRALCTCQWLPLRLCLHEATVTIQRTSKMEEVEARQGEVCQSQASTSGMEGTVQRLRELRVSDRQCVSYFFLSDEKG